MGIPIVYQFLRTILFLSSVFLGYYLCKGNRHSRIISSLVFCFLYVLIQGSRYNGGVDFPHYNEDLIYPYKSNYVEYLYLAYIHLIGTVLQLPSFFGFWGYAALLSVAIVLVANKLREGSIWILIVMLVANNQIENLIRQYFALSFIVFAFYFFLKGNKQMMYLSLLITPFVHYTGVYPVLLFLFLIHVSIPNCPLIKYGPLVLYFLLIIFWDVHVFDQFGVWLKMISRSNAVLSQNGYLHNADIWFSTQKIVEMSSGSLNAIKTVSVFVQNIMTIYFGYYLIRKIPRLTVCYYFWLISLFVSTVGGGLEMFIRFSQWTSIMTPFVIGSIIGYRIIHNIKLSYMYMLLVFLNYSYSFFSMSFKMPFGCAYFWDAL